ncbi:hypothetical protein ACSS6W_003157 [Trichoderma asperelloides]
MLRSIAVTTCDETAAFDIPWAETIADRRDTLLFGLSLRPLSSATRPYRKYTTA